ncbi:MAG: 2-isopropylmalate synthase [Christensenellales bacterium]|jgi:isopropylmalate/homocitrate/citramalate synthase
MHKLDKRSNLLVENDYRFSFQDVDKPKLFPDMFDYDSVPKITFNHRVVPMRMPDEIWMTDTTFRDGQQARTPFTVKQVIDLYKMQHKLGGPKGLIRQSEFFVYTDKDKEAVRACLDLGYKYPEVTTWIRASAKDFELVKEFGIKETGILVSCSDYHIFKKMGLNRKQAKDQYLGIIKEAIDHGIRPRCHFEDITRADYYGFVIPFADELMSLMQESGVPIKIRMCDTLGYGITYPGASLPRSVQGIVYGLRFYSGFPSRLLEWHGHNDFHKVVTNAATAWLYGASSVNCSILGIGERTGNCPLEAMVMEYCGLRGTTDGMDLTVITEMAEYFENELNSEISPRTPFVGRNFNSTRAGIHADGLLKDEKIYNIFNTEKILKRPVTVAINAHSGLAGIAHWINSHFKLKGDLAVNKKDNLVDALKRAVDAEFADGRTTSFGDDELEMIMSRIDEDAYIALCHHKTGWKE